MNYTITFEVDDSISKDQLHEALCKGIYEDDEESLEILATNVFDIISS